MFKILLSVIAIVLLWSIPALSEPPIPANYPIGMTHLQIQNEEQIFVCPTDSLIVLANWRDFMLGYRRVAVGRSTDGGNTWSSNLVILSLLRADYQSDPAMAVDNNGNFYMCMMDLQSATSGNKSFLTFLKSTNKGETWTGPYSVIPDPVDGVTNDKEFITVDRTNGPYEGNVYVSWARYESVIGDVNDNNVMFARSIDGAETFEEKIVIIPRLDFSQCGPGLVIFTAHMPFPLVGSDGSVYVFTVTSFLNETTCEPGIAIHMVKSIDGGQTFTPHALINEVHGNYEDVDGTIRVYNAPICAADISGGPFDGNIYVSYGNKDITNTEYGDWNIEFMRSSDGGETWSTPIYINDDFTGPGAMYDQFHPWLTINEEGTLIIIWYDQRTDPVNHYKFDVFAAYSFDGGESFTTNHRISEVSVDPDNLDSKKNKVRAGRIAEYIGVTAFKDHINAAWTDTRNGNQDVYGANWVIPFLKPRLLSPADGDRTLSSPDFNWATSWKHDDDRYLIEVATDDQFGNIIISETMTEPGYTVASALSDGTYFWRVKAYKISDASESEYSNTWEFIVDTYVPALPTLVSPPNVEIISIDCPEFVWSQPDAPPGPVYYNLEISGDETFTDQDITRIYQGLTGTSYTPADPVYEDTIYYWRVEAENWAGQTSGKTEPFSFELMYYICGDLDDDMSINILDIVFLINYLYKSGSAPLPLASADADGDGSINILDVVYIINFIYKNGPELICEE